MKPYSNKEKDDFSWPLESMRCSGEQRAGGPLETMFQLFMFKEYPLIMKASTEDSMGTAEAAHWRGFAHGSWGDSRPTHFTKGSERWRGSRMMNGQAYSKVKEGSGSTLNDFLKNAPSTPATYRVTAQSLSTLVRVLHTQQAQRAADLTEAKREAAKGPCCLSRATGPVSGRATEARCGRKEGSGGSIPASAWMTLETQGHCFRILTGQETRWDAGQIFRS